MRKSCLVIIVLLFTTGQIIVADTGVGESISHYLSSKPPAKPSLETPLNGTTGIAAPVLLGWQRPLNTVSFTLQISKNMNFIILVVNDTNLTDVNYRVYSLESYTLYYWRVRARNIAGEGNYSLIRHFTTDLGSPILSVPADLSTGVAVDAELRWNSVVGSEKYCVQVSTDENISNIVYEETDISDTSCVVTNLQNSVWYFWRVYASNESNSKGFSSTWSFKVSETGVGVKNPFVPQYYALLPVFPNPFNGEAAVTYLLPERVNATMVIYNCMGQAVRKLVTGEAQPGSHTVSWDGHDDQGTLVTSGLYLCRFEAGGRIMIRKMLMVR